jgi:hypothetical protein
MNLKGLRSAFLGCQIFLALSLSVAGCGSDSANPHLDATSATPPADSGVDATSVALPPDSGVRSETQTTTRYDGAVSWVDAERDVAAVPPQVDAATGVVDSGPNDVLQTSEVGSRVDVAADRPSSDGARDSAQDRPPSLDLVGSIVDTASVDGADGGAGVMLDGSSIDGPPQTCSAAGATECKNRLTLRTCQDGIWTEANCGNLQICSPGSPATCIPACNGLTAPSNAVIACTMPYDPTAAYSDPASTYNGAPMTAVTLTSDSAGLPRTDNFGAALDGLDLSDGTGDICASVVVEPSIGPAWRTPAPSHWYGRVYIWGIFELRDFIKKYGAVPSGISIYVKSRTLASVGALSPIPAFILMSSIDESTGDYAMVTGPEDDTASLSPDYVWTITHRELTKDEISSLSTDDKDNRWELDFVSSLSLPSASQPPENVEIAWYALVLTPPS